jgi:hypothetical protein
MTKHLSETPAAIAPRFTRHRGTDRSVLLDCDGVLLDWLYGFRIFAEYQLNRSIDPAGPRDFDLHQWLGLASFADVKPLIEAFNSGVGGHFGNLPALPGAVDAVNAFAHQGRDLHIITSCSTSQEAIQYRHDNLMNIFGNAFESIHCVGLRDSKRPILDSFRPALWVEDKFENALVGQASGHRSYLIRASHNAGYDAAGKGPNLDWVDGWSDIIAAEAA